MELMPAHKLNLGGVLSESNRIVSAHSGHFLALSIIFLFPLSCSIVIFPTLYLPTLRPNADSTVSDFTLKSTQTLVFPLICTFVVYLLSICSLATVTYSTHNGFHGRSLKLFQAIKSILFSFIPLTSTTIAAKFLITLISVTLLMFVVVIFKLAQNLGFQIDYNSSHFHLFCTFVGVVWGFLMLYFQVIWGLAPVIAVTESKWGFEPLWRSSYLVKGMRSVSLSLLAIFGIMIGVWVWMATDSLLEFAAIDDWRISVLLWQIISSWGYLTLLSILILHYIAAITVLYMYCKALHGELELAMEIPEDFGPEYVSLAVDDDAKVPDVDDGVTSA